MSEIRSQATPAREELAETVFDLQLFNVFGVRSIPNTNEGCLYKGAMSA